MRKWWSPTPRLRRTAPPQYGQPTPAPTPYGYPPPPASPPAAAQAQYYPASPAPAPAPTPYSYPASPAPTPSPYASLPTTETAAAPAQAGRPSGFHLALGLGFAGGGTAGRPGIATQVKIGGRLSPSLTLYYYALDNWYPTTGSNNYWRISAVNGVGVDYFVVPNLGGRFGIGLGGNMPEDWSNSTAKPRYLGYSYFMGLTWEVLDSRSHFSIDPVINVLQLSENSIWRSYADFLLTLNWVYN